MKPETEQLLATLKDELHHLPTYSPTPATTQLKAKIEPLFLSEEWGWALQQVCENAPTRDDLILKLLTSAEDLCMWIFKGFEKNQFVDAQKLNQFLLSNLKNILMYVFCTASGYFSIYTIGETSTGDYLGVSTVAIWT